jgi:hypothetical protein
VLVHRPLDGHGGADCLDGRREHDHQAIAEVLHLSAAVVAQRGAQEVEMAPAEVLGRVVT